MSYFDDVIEPQLYREPPIKKQRGCEYYSDVMFQKPTNAQKIPWRSADGNKITIGEMSDGHLINAHRLIGRRIGTEIEKDVDHVFYGFLRAEINRRGLNEM